MNGYRYDFERPIAELEHRLQDAQKAPKNPEALKTLEVQLEQLRRKIYSTLTPWQRVQLARHPQRPYTLDYIARLFNDFVQLHGDRLFGDDRALIGGLARFEGRGCIVLGHRDGIRKKTSCVTSAPPIRKVTARRYDSCRWRRNFIYRL